MRRTPRNFDGIESPGRQISHLLPEILSEIGRKTAHREEEIFQGWEKLLGEKMGPLTKPLSLIDGVLTVQVKSGALYSLLCQHEHPRLLKLLQEQFPKAKIRNLVFRRG